MHTGSDRELLIGVLSVQLGFANAQQVMSCAAEWATDRSQSLAQRMEDRAVLSATQRQLLEALVQQAIDVNKGDVKRTLISLGGERVLQSLGGSLIPPKPPTRVSADDDHDDATDPHSRSEEDLIAVSEEEPARYSNPDGKGPAEIGRGGIGRVLIAHDHFLERDVAIKELLPQQNSNPGGTPNVRTSAKGAPVVQRFLREARVTGKLEHPNIVPVYELGRRKDGTLYYSMKLVRGRTMADAIDSAKNLTERLSLLPHFLGICNALAYAHSRGVIHRDIKPQNVMVGEFGETVVLDWGLAKVRGRKDLGRGALKKDWVEMSGAHSVEGSAIGTPAYMSPEQAEGKVDEIDERSDVWSLGVMLYEVLTGRTPFDGVNPFDVLGKLLQDTVAPVQSVATDAPKELSAIAEKALQRDKALRYQTAKEFADDLSAYLSGRRVSAHEYSSMELVKRFTRKNRGVLAIIAIALVVVQVSVFAVYRQLRKERDSARQFAQLLVADVSQQLQPLPGSAPLLDKLTTSALAFYRRSVDPASSPIDERLELAQAYTRIAEVALAAGKHKEAIDAAGFAEEIYRRALTERPKDPAIFRHLATALICEGDAHYFLASSSPEAKASFDGALDYATRALATAPGDQAAIATLSRAYTRLGEQAQTTGDLEGALKYFTYAYDNDRANVGQQNANAAVYYRRLAIDVAMLGWVNRQLGRYVEAQQWLKQALTLEQELLIGEPNNRDYKVLMAYDQISLAGVERNLGSEAEYLRLLGAATSLLAPLVERDQNRATLDAWTQLQLLRHDYPGALATLGQMAEVSGSADMQAEMVEVALRAGQPKKAIELAEKVQNKLPGGARKTTMLAMYAAALALEGDTTKAREAAREAAKHAEVYGGTSGDREPGQSFMPDVTHARAGAVRALLNDLAAMRLRRDKDAWVKATASFVRALDQTP